MGILSILFGRKPAKPAKPTATPQAKKQPNRKAKRKMLPAFAKNYAPGYEWQTIQPERAKIADFVTVKGCTDLNVKNINSEPGTLPFFEAFDPDTATLEVHRVPENHEFADALEIHGSAKRDAAPVKLGYVPSEIAAKLATDFSRQLPLKATIRKVGQKSTGDAFFMSFTLYYPKAPDRKKYVLSN